MTRSATCTRTTSETDISVSLGLDGAGQGTIETGIGFFDHMLTALSRHALIDPSVTCTGDLRVDGHHTVEDCGLCIGQALRQALGNRAGIARFADASVPMDEALAFCSLDVSGRPYLCFDAPMPQNMIGAYDASLTLEFFRALSAAAGLTIHLRGSGGNSHHIAEALFKAFARALRQAVAIDPRLQGQIPSTKGALT